MTKRLVAVAALVLLAGCGAADHNDADVQFAQGMIPHHAQAVDMAEMALQKADDRQDMDALAQASGGAFDRMWLEMMLEHHRGAVSESQDEVAYGKDPDAVELAVEIARSQTAEISRMEELLAQQ